jgi:hypothetical protein
VGEQTQIQLFFRMQIGGHKWIAIQYLDTPGKGAVTWSSKKQPMIVLSSTESEYIRLTHATKEILWVRQFLEEILSKFQGPSQMYLDNQGAIALAQNNKYHPQSVNLVQKQWK